MLTKKQRQLLSHLNAEQQAGRSPSFDEMCTAMGLRSKSNIHRLVVALEERGFIQRPFVRARSIEVVRMPDDPVMPEWVSDRLDEIEAERDTAFAALDVANAEIVKLKAQNEHLRRLCEREHIAGAVAALEMAE